MLNEHAVPCYVEGNRAWFTTQSLDKQWGDDWNDAPYEHNAGRPYEPCWHNEPSHRSNPGVSRGWRPGTQELLSVGELCRCESCVRDWNIDGTPKWEVFSVYWNGPWNTPAEIAYSANSCWSVQKINTGAIAWLIADRAGEHSPPSLMPGVSCATFRKIVLQFGQLFEPVEA